jgi:phage terminase small subunit
VRFVAEYLRDLNATQAAIRAGYTAAWANKNATRLTVNDGIAAAVAKGTARHLASCELSAARVLEELRRLAFVDVTGVWDDAGNLKPFSAWSEEQKAALAGFEAIIKNAAAGDGHTDTVHKVRLHDKLKALDLLARHFKLLHDQVSIEGDWEKFAARLASAKARIRGGSGGDSDANVSPRHSVAR